jgi:hypothetical protein
VIDPSAIQGIQTQSLTLEDFSGGMTDYYLNGPLNAHEKVDNLLIVKHGRVGKLFTRPGSEIYVASDPQLPSGAQRVGWLKYFGSNMLAQSARKLYRSESINSPWGVIQGPTSNDLFPAGIDTTTVVSTAAWNGHLFITSSALTGKVSKLWKDISSVWKLRTAGMPALASSPTATPDSAGAVALSYLYRFLYRYTYTVGTVSFTDRGPTTEVAAVDAAGSAIAGGTPCAITGIPALANGATLNYDTGSTDLDVEIYRTTNGGVNFFYVGSVNNGTTTYSDTTTDAVLVDNEPLYTEAGVPENTEPPICKVVHIVDDRAFYGHCLVGSETLPSRVYQAVPSDPDSVPEDNYTTLPDEVVTISSYKSVPIVLGLASNYRLEGGFDELGGGFLGYTVISDVHGCVAQQSAVQTPYGVFWAGLDGFYWTDGYQSLRISSTIRQAYEAIVSSDERKRRIQGRYDSKENRVYWTAQYETEATECDTLFVLDLNWGISEEMPFTTQSGTSFAPTAIEFKEGQLIRGHKSGYVFIHDRDLYVDPRVDTGVAAASWSSETIIYDLKTAATNFGSPEQRKWVSSCSVVCASETNLSMQINSINDDGRRTASLKPIRNRSNIVWGEEDVYWGDPSVLWGGQGLIDEVRRMPAQSLRCQTKQLHLTNAHVAILSSDVIGTATTNVGASTVTLDDTASYDWPTQAVDYYIAFAHDDYVTEHLVTARTDDTLTVTAAGGGLPSGSQEWVIRGKPKGEILYLNSLTINYALFGQSQVKFRGSQTGEVGAE